MQIPSLGGAKYFVVFKDDHSSYRFVFIMKQKSNVYDFFKLLYLVSFNETGNYITKLRSNNAKEYLSTRFQTFIRNKGIRHETTAPYAPEQNSIVDRDNHSIVKCARSMLYHKHVPLTFWTEAVNTAAYILNRVASRTLHGLTPYEKWTGSKPNVSHLRVFGSLVYSHIPKEIRQKLDSKTTELLYKWRLEDNEPLPVD